MAVDITPLKDEGVLKEILREGTGDEVPMTGDEVTVHYVGTLLDGTKFDSSRDRNEHFKFTVGKGSVIKAWDIGILTMKRGELCKLTAKPEYAYGPNGTGGIPPNATLVFEVELFDFKGEDISKNKDGSITKRTITAGESYGNPNDGAQVKVHITGHYDGRDFDDRDVEFTVGEACDQNVIEGIDIGIKKLTKGEKAQLDIVPKLAFGSKGNSDFNIPANVNVKYTVELKEFEKARESWEMDSKEKIEQSNLAKSKGTNYFKAGKYRQAVKLYKRITDYLGSDDVASTDEEKTQIEQLRLAAFLNLAMCYLKVEDYFNAHEQCEKALEKDPENEKGLFRRGQARVHLQNHDGAISDFERVLKMDPTNKAAKNQLTLAQHQLKQFKEKEKKKYFGMFDKMAQADAKVDAERRKNEPPTKIDEWDNKMADGMLSIEKEAEAFKEHDGNAAESVSEMNSSKDLKDTLHDIHSDGVRQRKPRT